MRWLSPLACSAVLLIGATVQASGQVPSLSPKKSAPAENKTPHTHIFANKLAPYVSSPVHVVERMLELANLKAGETLYDLGCGDGRILIAAASKYKVKAVGVEISPKLVAEAAANIQEAGLVDRARVVNGDLLTADFSSADVVTLYLATSMNAKLRPRLERLLKAGARVVSSDFPVPGWKPAHVEPSDDRQRHMVYVYEMPAVKTGDTPVKN